MINIAVTGTGSLIGQAIIKCINASSYKDDVRLIGYDYFNDTVGSFWCDEHYLLPDIYQNPNLENEWVSTIEEQIEKYNLQFIFVGVDFELPVLAKHRDDLESKYDVKILVSDEKVIEIGNDKFKTVEFLKSHGLHHPITFKYENYGKEDESFPVILKPAVGARSRGVYVINNREDLDTKAKLISLPIVQELVGVDDTEYTCGILCLDGEFITSIVLNRSLKQGNTYIAKYQKDTPQEIYDYIDSIAKALLPRGSCNLQLRVDKNGIPKLFEINPRHSGTTYFRSLFGYNEVEMILDFYLGKELEIKEPKEGMVYRYYAEQFKEF